ncbi:MAG: hypothetical protein ABJZ55_04300 [Fuerstiella sp.]
MAIIMITFAFQLKTQPQIACFRHLLLIFSLCAVGCQDSASQPTTLNDSRSDVSVFNSSGVVASMDSVGQSDLPADGQRLGTLPIPDLSAKPSDIEPLQSAEVLSVAADDPRLDLTTMGKPFEDDRREVPAQGLLDQLQDSSVSPEVRESIQRIQLLRGSEISATGAAEMEVRRRRNFRIIDLVTRALPLAMSPSGDDHAFLQLIRFLLEARLELAVSGNADDIQSLYADVKALTQRDPSSKAAAEGVFTLARFAHEMVRRNGEDEPIWFDNFCQWSREFAGRFPDQKQRATALLLGSARTCELRALDLPESDQAIKCIQLATRNYQQLIEQFSDSIEASEATAVLRRLNLPGQILSQFSGQSLDGELIDGRSFVDIVTVVYFWEVGDPEFQEELLPLLQQASDVANGQLRFVGVPLADNPFQLNEFLQRHHVPGMQMIGSDPNHRGWNHPLVRFWGLSRGATCWLINRDRTVAAVDVTAKQLVSQMRILFRGP